MTVEVSFTHTYVNDLDRYRGQLVPTFTAICNDCFAIGVVYNETLGKPVPEGAAQAGLVDQHWVHMPKGWTCPDCMATEKPLVRRRKDRRY